MRTIFIRIAAVVIAAGLVLAGCTNPAGNTPTPEPPDTSALTAAINAAEEAKDGVQIAGSAAEVPKGLPWVTATEMTAFEGAIATAKAAKGKAATPEEVVLAKAAIEAALALFNTAVNANGPGTNTNEENLTPDNFAALIALAEEAVANVIVSIDGEDVPPSEKWLTLEDKTALQTAITTAKSAEFSAAVYLALAEALEDFEDAKQSGAIVDKTALAAAIADAVAAREGVVRAPNKESAPLGSEWVTQAQWDALDAVYITAVAVNNNDSATKNVVDQAAEDLTAAITTFITIKAENEPGTMTDNILTITGISAIYDNGTEIRLSLYEDKEATRFIGYVTSGVIEVTDGSLTFDLDTLTSGSYYVGFTAEEIFVFASKQKTTFTGSPVTLSYTYGDNGNFELLHHAFRLGDEGFTSGTLDQFFQSVGAGSYDAFKTEEEEWMKRELNSKLYPLIDMKLYKTAVLAQEYSGSDSVNANTVVYSKVSLGGYDGPQIGAISGTLTLTDIPASKPLVGIRASGDDWESNRPWLDLSSAAGTSGTFPWTIPLYEYDVYNGTWD
ncbi:MAG: hypothetical protein LBC62_05390, partial [Treponema sp.]|nr:hypothetical protein [Treponema sp.]